MDAGVALAQALRERAHQVRIRARHQLIQQLDHGNCAAKRVVDAGHLQADDAATDDEQFFWHVLQYERIGRIHHARIVPGEAWQLHRLRSGRDDALFEAHELLAVLAVDFDFIRRNELTHALRDGNFALLAHAGQAAGQLGHDFVLERGELADIDLGFTEADTDVAGVRGLVVTFAACSKAFDGMQPTLRHTPPRVA